MPSGLNPIGMLRRSWKALPEPLRRRANLVAQALGRASLPWLVRLAWRRGRPAGGPVMVAGLHRAVLGIGQGARLFTQVLVEAGVHVRLIDVSPEVLGSSGSLVLEVRDPPPAGRDGGGGVLVSHLNPPELERYLIASRARALRGRRHIGYWVWELPEAPPGWRRAFDYVDEVWTPSCFTAEALRAIAPPGATVRVVPHPIFTTPPAAADRARFALPSGACVVLMAFDIRSTAARKNPFAGLEAYLQAVPVAGEDARLVCKVVGGEAFPDVLADLRHRLAHRPDLVLMAETLDAAGMLTLVASADIVLSLHRAEGFGLLLAEGMWLGRPVIATAWSGNMDFMDDDSAALVGWRPVPVHDPQAMYAGATWAEPDVAEAAAKLAMLIADPAKREALGQRAFARAHRVFDREAWLEAVTPALLGLPAAQSGSADEGGAPT